MKIRLLFFVGLSFCSGLAAAVPMYVHDEWESDILSILDEKEMNLYSWARSARDCKDVNVSRGEYETREEFSVRINRHSKVSGCKELRNNKKVVLIRNDVNLDYNVDNESFSFEIERAKGPGFRRLNAPKDEFCFKMTAGGTIRTKWDEEFFSGASANFASSRLRNEYRTIDIHARSPVTKARELKAIEASLVHYIYGHVTLNKPNTPAMDEVCKEVINLSIRKFAFINQETDKKVLQVLFK